MLLMLIVGQDRRWDERLRTPWFAVAPPGFVTSLILLSAKMLLQPEQLSVSNAPGRASKNCSC
jgi:hypothetical protein